MEDKDILVMKDIVKTFRGVKALKGAALDVKYGEIHALTGENGAGKSTLMKCLIGIYPPASGQIYFEGNLIENDSTSDALKMGIAMIHQEPGPIEHRSIMENIWLGREPKNKLGLIDHRKMYEMTEEVLKEINLKEDPKTLMANLTVADMQMVEIAKALSYNAKLIIMDEPTSALANKEIDQLFSIMRRLKENGKSIIYISHKLEEIFEISDRVTVYRDGQYIGTKDTADITTSELIKMMVGRDIDGRFPKIVCDIGDVKLEAKNMGLEKKFKDASFHVRKGKIFGIEYGIILVLLIMIIGISILQPNFLSSTNLFNVITQSSIFGIMALGMTLVITSKGIDLSVGSVLALTGVIAASLGQVGTAATLFYPNLTDLPVIIPIAAAIITGACIGAVNGGLIAFTGIPALIATLGMMTVARGATLLYTGGKPVSQLTPGMMFIGSKIGAVPVPVIVYGIMIAVTWVLLGYTSFGKNIYAIGGNIKAAEKSGVNVKKNLVMIYSFMGICSAVAALVFAGCVGSVHPGAATGYELTAIAATAVGGTSLYGGIGTVWGAVAGALVLGVLRNGMTLLGIGAYWPQIVEGCIIIVAVIFDMRKNARNK